MTDLLQQIDAGIERHFTHKQGDGRFYCLCGLLSPCETLKAIQGWQEAEVRARAAEAIALGGKLCISQQHADLEARLREAVVEGERLKEQNRIDCGLRLTALQAAEAKLKDAEARAEVRCVAHGAFIAEGDCIYCDHEQEKQRAEDAEEKMRGLVEALGRAVALLDCWYFRPTKSRFDCREGHRCPACLVAADAAALTQAKREGE